MRVIILSISTGHRLLAKNLGLKDLVRKGVQLVDIAIPLVDIVPLFNQSQMAPSLPVITLKQSNKVNPVNNTSPVYTCQQDVKTSTQTSQLS